MKALTKLVLVLLLAGCAAEQGNVGRTPAEEETTAYKEETTVQEGAGDLKRPPESTLSYGGQEVKGTLGTYCWTSDRRGECVDSTGPPVRSKEKTLTVPSGSEVVFRYGGQSPPKTVEAGAYPLNKKGQLRIPPSHKKGQPGHVISPHPLEAHGSGIERTVPAELPPGEYVLEVSVEEPQGGATYYFRVMVE